MKHLWLLVPLILLNVMMAVWGAEGPYRVQFILGEWIVESDTSTVIFGLGKEVSEDIAEAMNEAHRNRLHEISLTKVTCTPDVSPEDCK